MKKYISIWLVLLGVLFLNGCAKGEDSTVNNSTITSFSLTFGTYGISSYDSSTGKLVKTTDTTKPEDYITTMFFDE